MSTTSPGAEKGTNTTFSSTLVIHLPSAAASVIVAFSNNGSGRFLRDIVDCVLVLWVQSSGFSVMCFEFEYWNLSIGIYLRFGA